MSVIAFHSVEDRQRWREEDGGRRPKNQSVKKKKVSGLCPRTDGADLTLLLLLPFSLSSWALEAPLSSLDPQTRRARGGGEGIERQKGILPLLSLC